MKNNKCDCTKCENWESCEIKMVIHYPIDHFSFVNDIPYEYEIKKGDKIGQLILCRHEGYLLPSEYTKAEERSGGFGSTGK